MKYEKCSICDGEVVRGRSVIKKSLMALMSWPWASDRLDFIKDNTAENPQTQMRQGIEYESYKCLHCGALLITGKRQ